MKNTFALCLSLLSEVYGKPF